MTGRVLTILALITDNKKDTTKQFTLLTTDKDTLAWDKRIKEFGWYDNQKFGLKFLSGNLWIAIDVDNSDTEEIKTPKKMSVDKIDKYLAELKSLPTT